jgi:hypothetical protein
VRRHERDGDRADAPSLPFEVGQHPAVFPELDGFVWCYGTDFTSRLQTLAELSDDERAVVQERFRLLEPHLRGCRELRSIAERTNVSFRTLQRWVAGYKRDGLPGLLRRPRADRGERRMISTRLREAAEGLALEKPPLPLTSVHRRVSQFAQLIGEAAPSYWGVTTPNVKKSYACMLDLWLIVSTQVLRDRP